jgi:hypothetical protein
MLWISRKDACRARHLRHLVYTPVSADTKADWKGEEWQRTVGSMS